MTSIDIKVDGSSIVADVLFAKTQFTGLADGNVGQAAVTVRNLDSQYAPGDFRRGMTLELFIDGQREWDGWIFVVKRGWPFDVLDTRNVPGVPKFWTLGGLDRNILFRKRILFRQDDPADPQGLKIWPQGTTDREALLYVLENYVNLTGDGLTIGPGIKSISTPGPDQEFTLAHVSAMLGVAFDDASKVTGGVFYIDPDRVLQYRGDTTVSAPFALSDKPGTPAGSVGYREAIAWESALEMANEAWVWGAGRGSDQPVLARYRDEESIDAHGLWQWGDIFVGAYKQQTVNKRAETYVEGSPDHRRGHGEDVPSVDCTIFTPGIRVGHVVDFYMNAYGYNEPLPVRKSTITFPTTTSAKFELELTLKVDAPFSAPDLWPQDGPGKVAEDLPPLGSLPVSTDLLIDHYDVPLPAIPAYPSYTEYGFAETIIVGEADPATVATPGLEDYVLWGATIPLPNVVEDGDILMMHGVIVLSGSSAGVGWGLNATGSDGWTLTDAASHLIASCRVRTQAPFNVSPYQATFTWEAPRNSDQSNWLEVMFVGVKGKAYHASFVDAGSGAAFNPAQSYPNFSGGDHSYVIGVALSTDGIGSDAAPLNTTPLTLEFMPLNSTYAQVSVVGAYLGDTYTANFIQWGPGGWPFAPTKRWWRIAEEVRWVTPGPERTGHSVWLGGNEYVTGGNDALIELVAGESEVQATASFSSGSPFYTYLAIFDDYRYYIDDDGSRVGEYEQGQWVNAGSPEAPWQGPMDWVFKFRTDDLAGGGVGYVDLEHYMMELDPGGPKSELDAGGTERYVVAWLAEIYVSVAWNASAFRVDIYNAYNGGTGILPEVVSDTSESHVSGDLDFTKYSDWEHNWWFNPLASVLPTPNTEYFLRVDETEIYNAEAGARRFRVKLWRADEQEPSRWLVDGVMPMYKAAAYKHLGHDSVGGAISPGDFSSSYASYWIAWMWSANAGNPMGLDAVWSRSKSYVGSLAVDVPIYDSVDFENAGIYTLQFPYRAGTLEVYYQGQKLVEGVDYFETDPLSGQFRVADSRDISSSLQVVYERYGSELTTAPSGGRVYRPAPVLQYGWGSRFDGYNCTMACGSMALDRHTLGAITALRGSPKATPPTLRSLQNDQSEGTDLYDVALAWQNGWNQTLTAGIYSWSGFVAQINSGRGAIVQGLYGALPASKRFSNSFTGGHAIYINEQLPSGNFWGYDPLYRQPVVYTASELQAYAQGLSWVSSGHVSAGFTKVTG